MEPDAPKNEIRILVPPVFSDWECEVWGGTILRPLEHGEPNWFHRWMQKVVFGFKWKRRTEC